MTRCHDIRPYLEAFGDDELSTEKSLDVEQHLGSCARCAEQLSLGRALKRTTREVVKSDGMPSPEFMARLQTVFAEEREREEVRQPHSRPLSWRLVAPLAAAAALVLTFGAVRERQQQADGPLESRPRQVEASVNLMDELVRYHAAPAIPEVTDRSALGGLEAHVGVPMRGPDLSPYGARFLGASLVPVEHHRAASLQYNVAGHRVTVYVFNPQWVPVRSLRSLEPRVIGDRAVFVGVHNGYSIAAIEKRGVGYVIATDLDDRESAEMVASIP
jgi:anti-sigma factor RsiW